MAYALLYFNILDSNNTMIISVANNYLSTEWTNPVVMAIAELNVLRML